MPPKKQKQTAKNAFFYFMMDFKGMQGKSFKDMKQLSEAAGEHWQRMSKDQKKPYEEKALFEKNNMKPGKYTSDGVDIEVLERKEKKAVERIEEMKTNINEELSLAAREGNIQDKMLFLIHINHFCYCSSEKRYYPAEIAVVGFNLFTGVHPDNIYHCIINPGALPLGFASEALKISNESHQIPPPLASETENNSEEVYFGMKHFLQRKMRGTKKIPVLYCHEKYMQMVQDILDMWRDDFNDNALYNVYNLQYMFQVLRNSVAGNKVWPSDSFSFIEIDKDVNAFAKGIACDYHERTNVPVYCSRSIVIRYVYTICDNCCPDLQISLMPGSHIPQMAAIGLSRPSSVASGVSSRSSRSKPYTHSVCDDDVDTLVSLSMQSDWETQSVTSEVSTTNEYDFPSIKGKKNDPPFGFTPQQTSSLYSQSSSRSYAGATGTAGLSSRPSDMPSTLAGRMDKLTLDSASASSVPHSSERGVAGNFPSSTDDFPALGRGRGTRNRGRNVTQPKKTD